MFDEIADDHAQRIYGHFQGFRFGLALSDAPGEIRERDHEASGYGIGFEQRIKAQHCNLTFSYRVVLGSRVQRTGLDLSCRMAGHLDVPPPKRILVWRVPSSKVQPRLASHRFNSLACNALW